ncbi:Myb-like DNA-binding domain protein [Ancylostoma caninum]|uniref:Myb-like DNA-binding domain protein n=1 Tax=Ancylostoma caninum TaxID=29170 RepID=A0A368HBB0_ANCCA|nr:Myb-like DNA-binding domain protein [Ancylostoma caninum]
MSSDPKEEEVDESILDEPVEGANLAADEEIDESILDHEMEIDAPSNPPSELHSDAHSEGSPPHSSHEIKEETSNDAQHTDTDEKPKPVSGESTPKKTPTKRARRSRIRRNETDDEVDDDEKDDDMESDHKAMLSSADRKINVGDDFQARVDDSHKDDQLLPRLSEEECEREYVMWRPPGDLDETKLMDYCEDAIGVYKLTYDRALYILQKSNFDFDVAREKVKRRRLITEEWCEDDRTLFKQAFHMFGKRFDKIRQTMPHRSMASIIQFYYNTKKDTDYKSLFDSRIADDSDEEEGIEAETFDGYLKLNEYKLFKMLQ